MFIFIYLEPQCTLSPASHGIHLSDDGSVDFPQPLGPHKPGYMMMFPQTTCNICICPYQWKSPNSFIRLFTSIKVLASSRQFPTYMSCQSLCPHWHILRSLITTRVSNLQLLQDQFQSVFPMPPSVPRLPCLHYCPSSFQPPDVFLASAALDLWGKFGLALTVICVFLLRCTYACYMRDHFWTPCPWFMLPMVGRPGLISSQSVASKHPLSFSNTEIKIHKSSSSSNSKYHL